MPHCKIHAYGLLTCPACFHKWDVWMKCCIMICITIHCPCFSTLVLLPLISLVNTFRLWGNQRASTPTRTTHIEMTPEAKAHDMCHYNVPQLKLHAVQYRSNSSQYSTLSSLLIKMEEFRRCHIAIWFSSTNAEGCFFIELLMHRVSKRHLALDVFTCCLWCYFCVDKLYQFQFICYSI